MSKEDRRMFSAAERLARRTETLYSTSSPPTAEYDQAMAFFIAQELGRRD
jgi:hypothetical protein